MNNCWFFYNLYAFNVINRRLLCAAQFNLPTRVNDDDMTNANDSRIGLIEKDSSTMRRLCNFNPSKRQKSQFRFFRAILTFGLIAAVFVSGGYGKLKEESTMQNEQLAEAPNTLDLV